MIKYYLILLLVCTNCFSSNKWECTDQVKEIKSYRFCDIYRIEIPTGWIIKNWTNQSSFTFVYDPFHQWIKPENQK